MKIELKYVIQSVTSLFTWFCLCSEDGKPHSLLHLLEMDLEYGNEFYGSRMPVVLTPMSERYFLTLTKV